MEGLRRTAKGMENLLKLDEPEPVVDDPPSIRMTDPKRERLIALIAGGRAKHYLDKDLSIDKIETMKPGEIDKLYSRYEARLGAEITKSLGNTIIQLYSQAASMYLPIDDQSKLTTDLKGDPFLGHALNSLTCELYHKFGVYLAPLTTALTTIRHMEIKNSSKYRNNDDGGRNEVDCYAGGGSRSAEGEEEGRGGARN